MGFTDHLTFTAKTKWNMDLCLNIRNLQSDLWQLNYERLTQRVFSDTTWHWFWCSTCLLYSASQHLSWYNSICQCHCSGTWERQEVFACYWAHPSYRLLPQPRAATSSKALAWAGGDSDASPFPGNKAGSPWLPGHSRGMGDSVKGAWLWLFGWVSLTVLPNPRVQKYGNSPRRDHSQCRQTYTQADIGYN